MNKLIATTAAVALALVFGILLSSIPQRKHVTITTGSDPDPYAHPIYDENEAISRTIAALPENMVAHSVEARLVTTTTANSQWFEEADSRWMPDAPIWLVGITGDEIRLEDALIIKERTSIHEDESLIEGAFIAWNANSGDIVAAGEMYLSPGSTAGGSTHKFNLQRLALIVNEPLVITHATSLPPIPTDTP